MRRSSDRRPEDAKDKNQKLSWQATFVQYYLYSGHREWNQTGGLLMLYSSISLYFCWFFTKGLDNYPVGSGCEIYGFLFTKVSLYNVHARGFFTAWVIFLAILHCMAFLAIVLLMVVYFLARGHKYELQKNPVNAEAGEVDAHGDDVASAHSSAHNSVHGSLQNSRPASSRNSLQGSVRRSVHSAPRESIEESRRDSHRNSNFSLTHEPIPVATRQPIDESDDDEPVPGVPSRQKRKATRNAPPNLQEAVVLFIATTYCLIGVELTIQWNNITGINNLNSVGQLIPFIIGATGFINAIIVAVRHFRKQRKKRHGETESETPVVVNESEPKYETVAGEEDGTELGTELQPLKSAHSGDNDLPNNG